MKTAVIGLGAMGKRHLAAIASLPDLQLVGVADTQPAMLGSVLLPRGTQRFDAPAELLGELQPELVVVATTAPSHQSLVELAAQAGARAILCEKPIACCLADARQMIERCRNAGAALAVNHCRRHVPAYRWLAQEISRGTWGELRGVRIGIPGIGLGCLATHFIDLARCLAGEDLREVAGWLDPECGPNPRGAEFHDPGGLLVAIGTRSTRFVVQQIEDAAGPTSIILDCTEARVVIEERTQTVEILQRRAMGADRKAPPQYEVVEPPVTAPLDLDIVALTAQVLQELMQGGTLTCEAEHGYRSLEAVVAGWLSHERGQTPVSLPLDAPGDLARYLPIT